MPEATLDAVADHGLVTGNTIAGTYEDATRLFEELAEAGIDYDDVVAGLETAAYASSRMPGTTSSPSCSASSTPSARTMDRRHEGLFASARAA